MTPVEDRLRDLRAATRSRVKASPQLLSRIRETTARPPRLRDRLFKRSSPSKLWELAMAVAAITIILSIVAARHPFSPEHATGAQTAALTNQQPIPSSFIYQYADADPEARRILLISADGKTKVPVVVLPDGSSVLGLGDLALLRKDKTYQLWGIVGGHPVSLRVVGPNPDFVSFTVPPAVTVLFMTVEDEGGVVTTTMAPVVSGSVMLNGTPRSRAV